MIIAQIKSLEFHLKRDRHTVLYAAVAAKAEFKEPNDRCARHVVADTVEQAVVRLQLCAQEWLQQFVEARLNPRDFRMAVWFTPVEDQTGAFWNIYAHCGGNHPVCPTP